MIIKRIFFSFVAAALISLGIAALGLLSTSKLNKALVGIIETDLPASEDLGEVGRQIMSIQSSLNALLNPNLDMEQRRSPHAAYSQAKDDLTKVMADFNNWVKAEQGDARITQVVSDWRELEGTTKDWLAVSDQIVGKYKLWEETLVLNPTALLMNLEKFRGDHYFLVRRMSEMIVQGKPLGAEVSSDAGLCAFGRWQTGFENGSDLLAGNTARKP